MHLTANNRTVELTRLSKHRQYAGVVLFQLMQDLDLDLGEAENNNGSSFDIRDGILSTRIIAQYVVGCLSEGDDGWLHLWTDAFEQQYKQFQGMTGAAISALAEATVMQHTVGSMHANCSSRGGVNGNEVELPDHAVSTVAQYDRHLRQFVVASMARQAVARIKPKL
ncbi:hypothetical protein N9K47_00055 [bacterium]|nr:hypothetical protein [bacterium]